MLSIAKYLKRSEQTQPKRTHTHEMASISSGAAAWKFPQQQQNFLQLLLTSSTTMASSTYSSSSLMALEQQQQQQQQKTQKQQQTHHRKQHSVSSCSKISCSPPSSMFSLLPYSPSLASIVLLLLLLGINCLSPTTAAAVNMYRFVPKHHYGMLMEQQYQNAGVGTMLGGGTGPAAISPIFTAQSPFPMLGASSSAIVNANGAEPPQADQTVANEFVRTAANTLIAESTQTAAAAADENGRMTAPIRIPRANNAKFARKNCFFSPLQCSFYYKSTNFANMMMRGEEK